ncbi:MAG: prolipoprotein diacylglyceryl transferase [Gemmatimonadaceae bacterium]|jgi:phosphatidylglycerol:prolipoprotein diacylglycerol transferase|nr:prolipoprotein diacylglyceryl transferase [Gemmatimonadaceae bacterium]
MPHFPVPMTIPYPEISPIIFKIGPFALRWYGTMYLLGYVVGRQIAVRRARRGLIATDADGVDSLIAMLVLGMLVGARLVYATVYDPSIWTRGPFEIFAVWHGGLSFHGAIIGMATAGILFARKAKLPMLSVLDTIAYSGTPGICFGRLGNFINAELYGRATDVPWAMVFPSDPQGVPRHPSQLYEAFGEGVLLFFLLQWLQNRASSGGWYRHGMITAAFLIGYGIIRFGIEFTRQPDAQIGFLPGGVTVGQLLCAAMIAVGATLWMSVRGREVARTAA